MRIIDNMLFTVVIMLSLCGANSAVASSYPVTSDNMRQYGSNDSYCDCCRISRIDIDSLKSSIRPDKAIEDYYSRVDLMTELPLVFSGYRSVIPFHPQLEPVKLEMRPSSIALDSLKYVGILTREEISAEDLEDGDEVLEIESMEEAFEDQSRADLRKEMIMTGALPEWLRISLRSQRIQRDLRYEYMFANPQKIAYASWNLPEPPKLPDEDNSYMAFLDKLQLPKVDTSEAIIPEFEVKKRHWLHKLGAGLQFSQAYVSSNWYQGGSNYLSLLFNFNWDVALNTVFHPNLMFNSNLSYKLAINTNPKGSLHKYSISQDQFQYNLKAGIKAWEKWFYSVTMQFKTEFFNIYPQDSPDISASFLSPADYNVGLGMTYNLLALKERLKFSASIAPFSYNLKICASDRIDHLQFNIAADRHTHSEFGSNAELTLEWALLPNVKWKSRMFLFTDYRYFQADWENTFNFNFNRFLSTQLYIYPRFDSSSDFNSSRWHYWMLKEILSVGFTYEFSTKP